MKYSDYMIGDWVKLADGSMSQISELDKYCIRVEGLGNVDIISFDPIPLTPEIFEKNGFEHKPAPHWITDKDKEKDYYLQKTLDEIVDEYYVSCRYFHKVGETILDIITNNRLSFNGVIHYVHQLQHALRLCGIEKEITL